MGTYINWFHQRGDLNNFYYNDMSYIENNLNYLVQTGMV